VSLLWLRAARTCAWSRGRERPLCVRLTLFTWITLASRFSLWREKGTKGKNDEQTPAGAYPVQWPIQRCKICIYDPEWTPKITKYKRRFSWFWIILHSPPWPPLTPSDTAPTFSIESKGSSRASRHYDSVLILSTEIPWTGPREQRIPRWFSDGRTSESRRIKNLSVKDGSFDRKEMAKYWTTSCNLSHRFRFLLQKNRWFTNYPYITIFI